MRTLKLFFFIFMIFLMIGGQAQTLQDTVLRWTLVPNEQIKAKIQQSKDVKQCELEGSVCIITCANTSKAISKVYKIITKTPADVKTAKENKPIAIPQPQQPMPQQTQNSISKKQEKYDPKVDAFLNIEDESIFSDEKFINVDKEKVHPRSYNYYCLISEIRQFIKKLDSVENLKLGQEERAKQLLGEMDELFLKIRDDSVLEYLSPKQKDYYGKIKARYNHYDYIER